MPSSLRRWLGRIGGGSEEGAWEDPRLSAQRASADKIAEASDRQYVVLKGTIRSVSEVQRATANWLEAQLDDGTATVTLVWMGRPSIPGIEPGRVLKAEGRLSDADGKRKIYNPLYTLL